MIEPEFVCFFTATEKEKKLILIRAQWNDIFNVRPRGLTVKQIAAATKVNMDYNAYFGIRLKTELLAKGFNISKAGSSWYLINALDENVFAVFMTNGNFVKAGF